MQITLKHKTKHVEKQIQLQININGIQNKWSQNENDNIIGEQTKIIVPKLPHSM